MTRLAFDGVALHPGIATGRARRWPSTSLSAPMSLVRDDEVEAHVERLRRAFASASEAMEETARALPSGTSEEVALVFDAHVLLRRDVTLFDRAARRIRERREGAGHALLTVVAELRDRLLASGTPYLRERVDDLAFLARDVLQELARDAATPTTPASTTFAGGVVVFDHASPADVAHAVRSGAVGLVFGRASRTSHTAIVARAMGLPALVLGAPAIDAIGEGVTLLVDADRGALVVAPTDLEPTLARERHAPRGPTRVARRPTTADGVAISLSANFDGASACSLDVAFDGIGLVRTELCFLDVPDIPDEATQRARYEEILSLAGDAPVTFRTFDLGRSAGGTLALIREGLEMPVRLHVSRPDAFAAQVRAIARACKGRPMRVVVPLVATLSEWLELERAIHRAVDAVGDQGPSSVAAGPMIETPAAALDARAIARHADLVRVGTNDLAQLLFGADRRSSNTTHACAPTLHRLLRVVAAASTRSGEPPTVCGELVLDQLGLALLVGAGFRHFSIAPVALDGVVEALGRLHVDRARRALRVVLRAPSGDDALHEAQRALGHLR